MCIYICTYRHTHTHPTYLHAHITTYIITCMHVPVYEYVHACAHVHMHPRITHKDMLEHIQKRAHTYVQTHTHSVCIHLTCACICMQCTFTYTRFTYIHSDAKTHTHTPAHTHTRMHASETTFVGCSYLKLAAWYCSKFLGCASILGILLLFVSGQHFLKVCHIGKQNKGVTGHHHADALSVLQSHIQTNSTRPTPLLHPEYTGRFG